MKKILSIVILAMLLVSSFALVMPTSAAGEALPDVYNLHVGKDQTVVGTVQVWNDADNLYIKYAMAAGWAMTETHLSVATSLEGIPQRNGSPVPERFEFAEIHDSATEYTYTISNTWATSTNLYLAAHASVTDALTSRHPKTQAAWAGTNTFSSKKLPTYFTYTVTEPISLEGWNIEITPYGGVSVEYDHIYFSAGGIGANAFINKEFTPQSSFTYSLKVHPYGMSFWMLFTGTTPIVNAQPTVRVYFDGLNRFSLDGTVFTGMVYAEWFTLKMVVQHDPCTVTAEVYDDNGQLLGSTTATSPSLSFADIRYVACGVGSHSAADVKDLAITVG